MNCTPSSAHSGWRGTGAAGAVFGAGSQLVDFLKSAGQIGMGKLLRAIGGEKLAAIGALAMLIVQNLAGEEGEANEGKASKKDELQFASREGTLEDTGGEPRATDAQADYTVKATNSTSHADITIGFDYAGATTAGKVWFWAKHAITIGLAVAAFIAVLPIAGPIGLVSAIGLSIAAFSVGWSLADIAVTFSGGPRGFSLPRRRRRRVSILKRPAFAGVPS